MERCKSVLPTSLVLVVIGIAWGMRVLQLDSLPPGTDRDVATNGVYTLYILHENLRPLFYRIGAAEPLIVYLQSLSVAVAGVSIFSLRIVTAIIGTLTVPSLYAAVRLSGFNWRVAVVAAFGLAVSVEHVHLSRLGLRAILIPLLELLVLYFFWRGIQSGRQRFFVIAGVMLGIGYYSYISGLFLPLIPLFLVAHGFLVHRDAVRTGVKGLAVAGVTSILVAAPFLYFMALYPGTAFFRASQVTLFQHPDYDRLGLLGVLGLKLLSQAKMFGLEWEGQYNPLSQPLLDPVWFAFLLIGLIVCLRQFKKIEYAWGLLLIGLMLLPDLIGGNELFPQELRIIGIIPPTFFVAAVGLAAAADWARPRLRTLAPAVTPAIAVVLAVALGYSFREYFLRWQDLARTTDDANFTRAEVAEGKWIAQSVLPVLVPLNEYARQPVRYLAGARAPRIASALDAGGLLRPDLLNGPALAMFPIDPTRVRFEGRAYADDPAAFVLVKDGAAYLLPPVASDFTASVQKREPVQYIPYPFGSVAQVYSISLSDLRLASEPSGQGVRFGPNITLAAYSLDETRAQPGGTLDLSLWWRTSRRLSDDEMIFIHLLEVDEQVAVNADVIPGLGAYSTLLWKPDETVVTHHRIKLPARLRPGRYAVEVGMYNIVNGNRLDSLDARGNVVDSRLVVGNVKIAPRQPVVYNPTHRQTVNFDNQPFLLGYDIQPTANENQYRVSLYWKANAELQRDYTVFVHVLDQYGQIAAQSDHQPQGGNYPTSIWDEGESIRDDFDIQVPENALSRQYQIRIGWYELETGKRLPVRDVNNQVVGDSIVLDTPLEVERH